MSMQAMASFMEKAQSDPKLGEDLVSLIDQNEREDIYPKVVSLAGEHGFSVTVKDVQETRQQFEQVDASGDGELSDDDLENVSGGIAPVVIAGLITAVALVLQFMSQGQGRAEALLRAHAGRRFVRWVGAGLGIAGLTGVGAFFWGRPFLTSAHGHPHVPVLGDLPLASAALFDLGVYLTVVGATLLTISVLGTVSREVDASSVPSSRSLT